MNAQTNAPDVNAEYIIAKSLQTATLSDQIHSSDSTALINQVEIDLRNFTAVWINTNALSIVDASDASNIQYSLEYSEGVTETEYVSVDSSENGDITVTESRGGLHDVITVTTDKKIFIDGEEVIFDCGTSSSQVPEEASTRSTGVYTSFQSYIPAGQPSDYTVGGERLDACRSIQTRELIVNLTYSAIAIVIGGVFGNFGFYWGLVSSGLFLGASQLIVQNARLYGPNANTFSFIVHRYAYSDLPLVKSDFYEVKSPT